MNMGIINKYIQNLTLRKHHAPMRLYINLGSNEEKKEVKICTALPAKLKKEITSLIHEFADVDVLNCKCTILSSSIKDYRSHRDVNSKQILKI